MTEESAGDSVGSGIHPECAVLSASVRVVSHLLSHPGIPAAFHSMPFSLRMSCITLFLYKYVAHQEKKIRSC